MKSENSLNSSVLANEMTLESIVKESIESMGGKLITFAQADRPTVSKWVILDKDGITWDSEFKTKGEALRHLVHEDSQLFDNCRAVVFEYENRPNSDEQELNWMYNVAETEAKELGYEIKENTP